MQDALSLAGTRAELGVRLERLFFGWIAYAVYAFLLLPFAWSFLLGEDYVSLLIAFGLIFFLLHILRRFIQDELADGSSRPIHSDDIPSLLSFPIVREIAGHEHVTGGILLEAAARTQRGDFMLREMGIDPKVLVEQCRDEVEKTIDLVPFLQYAVRMLPELNERTIDANVLLLLLFQHVPACQKLLHDADLSVDDMQGIVQWEAFHHRFRLHGHALDPETIRRAGAMGRSWVMGYTDALDWLTEEVSTQPQTTGEGSIVIHRESIESILAVLSRSQLRNVLVLGKVGIGKRTLVHNVACALRDHERRNHLPFTRVLSLKTQQLLSGVANPDSFFLQAFNRAQGSGRFLLLMEDLPVFLKSASPQLKAVLLKFLQARMIAIVALADTQDYHTLVKTDPMLDSLFEKVTVEDASDEETMKVLMAHYFSVAQPHGIVVTFRAMKSILELTKRYLGSRGGFPGKAIEIFDDVILRVRQSGETIVRDEHVREVITLRSRVNVQKVGKDERDRLLNLEEIMRKHVIGQELAVKAVVSALKRARLDISERKRPIGTFLFLGPTGVGKTQTAKTLATEYFGDVDALVRLDMNEFSHENSVFGIIGGESGAKEGFLAQRVQDNPFTLILLDEIEKAHPKVLNVFLQILDEGTFNDARGVKTDFRNCIIIATSNAGALFIRDYIKEHTTYNPAEFKKDLLDNVLRAQTFSPEFVNRFDEVVLFTPLSPENSMKVGTLMLQDVIDDVHRKRGIHIVIEEDLIKQLVERGYSVEFGAREMRRTITDIIEDYLADYLLRNDVKRGEKITVRKEDLKW